MNYENWDSSVNILDLPVERQREIAIEDGYASLEDWQEEMAKSLEKMHKFREESNKIVKLCTFEELTPLQQAKYKLKERRYTAEDGIDPDSVPSLCFTEEDIRLLKANGFADLF